MPEQTTTKSIGNYKMTFRTFFNLDNSEHIILQVRISEELKNLIKSVTLNDEADYEFYDGDQHVTKKRYKVKKWVFSSLNPQNRNSLFQKELLDSGEAKFKFACVSSLDSFMRDLKNNTKSLIQIIHNYSEINTTVSFNLEK